MSSVLEALAPWDSKHRDVDMLTGLSSLTSAPCGFHTHERIPTLSLIPFRTERVLYECGLYFLSSHWFPLGPIWPQLSNPPGKKAPNCHAWASPICFSLSSGAILQKCKLAPNTPHPLQIHKLLPTAPQINSKVLKLVWRVQHDLPWPSSLVPSQPPIPDLQKFLQVSACILAFKPSHSFRVLRSSFSHFPLDKHPCIPQNGKSLSQKGLPGSPI